MMYKMIVMDLEGKVLQEREDYRASVITDKMGLALHHYRKFNMEVRIEMRNSEGILLAEGNTITPKK